MLFLYEGNIQVSSDIDSLPSAVSPRSTETGAIMSVALQLHNFVFQTISRLQELS